MPPRPQKAKYLPPTNPTCLAPARCFSRATALAISCGFESPLTPSEARLHNSKLWLDKHFCSGDSFGLALPGAAIIHSWLEKPFVVVLFCGLLSYDPRFNKTGEAARGAWAHVVPKSACFEKSG